MTRQLSRPELLLPPLIRALQILRRVLWLRKRKGVDCRIKSRENVPGVRDCGLALCFSPLRAVRSSHLGTFSWFRRVSFTFFSTLRAYWNASGGYSSTSLSSAFLSSETSRACAAFAHGTIADRVGKRAFRNTPLTLQPIAPFFSQCSYPFCPFDSLWKRAMMIGARVWFPRSSVRWAL